MILGRVEQKSRGRVKNKKPNAIRIASAEAAASTVTITFDQPVSLMKTIVPQYAVDVAGPPVPEPVSAVMTSPTVMVLTYSGAVATATELTIPVQDAAIRNAAGGYVADTTFLV